MFYCPIHKTDDYKIIGYGGTNRAAICNDCDLNKQDILALESWLTNTQSKLSSSIKEKLSKNIMEYFYIMGSINYRFTSGSIMDVFYLCAKYNKKYGYHIMQVGRYGASFSSLKIHSTYYKYNFTLEKWISLIRSEDFLESMKRFEILL